jgi:hypothetical protein
MDNEKLKILMFDMILHFKFVYNPKKYNYDSHHMYMHMFICLVIGESQIVNFSLGGTTRNHLTKIIGKLDLI